MSKYDLYDCFIPYTALPLMHQRLRLQFFTLIAIFFVTNSPAAEPNQTALPSRTFSYVVNEQNKQLSRIVDQLQSLTENTKDDDNKKKMDLEDLEAQKNMAHWAELMFWATIASSLAAVASIVLLLRTLIQNTKSIEIAGNSLKHSERTAQIQLRAYVGIEITDSWKDIFSKPRPVIEWKIKNFGTTPARNLGIKRGVVIKDIETDESYSYVHPIPEIDPAQILMPTSEILIPGEFTNELVALIPRIKARKSKILIDTEIIYKDIFGNQNRTTLRYVIYNSINGELVGHFSDYGNGST